MLVRTPHRQQWYKSLLKTGVFALWFRSEADKEKYKSLPQSEQPFLVVQEVDTPRAKSKGLSRDGLSDGNELDQFKIDILYLPLKTHLSKVVRILEELGVTDKVQGVRKKIQTGVCKMIIGFNDINFAAATCKALHGEMRVDQETPWCAQSTTRCRGATASSASTYASPWSRRTPRTTLPPHGPGPLRSLS
jgi:hypothetical protein